MHLLYSRVWSDFPAPSLLIGSLDRDSHRITINENLKLINSIVDQTGSILGEELMSTFELSDDMLDMELNEAFQQTLDVVSDVGSEMQSPQMLFYYSLAALYGSFIKSATAGMNIAFVFCLLSNIC